MKNETIKKGMITLSTKLFPICRSITGNGLRQTLNIIQEHIPIKIFEVPSGTKVFDWSIPREWNIHDAYIKDSKGKKIIDFKKSNLHVVGYSVPVKKKMPFNGLREHLHYIPEKPKWIPYITSYYKEEWGFCLSYEQYKKLKNGVYEVNIDSELKTGALSYGELFIPGKVKDEILLTTYVCHPSLANDNLSGALLLTFLAETITEASRKYSYRFLFVPETIGAIAWIAKNQEKLKNIKYGLVATCVGDRGSYTYKKTRAGDSYLDRVVMNVLKNSGEQHTIVDFFPAGSDERQFSSPGINLPMGSLMRTMYGKFPEYHTSADNLDFISPESLLGSYEHYRDIIYVLENDGYYLNLNPKCEPMLGNRGLYNVGKKPECSEEEEIALRWVLNFSDGRHSLLDISNKSGINFRIIKRVADRLIKSDLLKETLDFTKK